MNRSESKYFNTAVKMDMALMEILKNKSFEFITVSEICEKAGVNRSTFYLHYENIGNLLDETVRYLLDEFLSYFEVKYEKEEIVFVSEKYILPYLEYCKDNKAVFITALKNGKLFGFDAINKRMFDNVFNPILEKFSYPESERKYIMKFYLTGITAVVNEWLLENCEKPKEEVVKIIEDCIFGLNNH